MRHVNLYMAAALAVMAASSAAAPALAQPPAASMRSLTPPPPASDSAGDVALWRAGYMSEVGVLPVGATPKGVEYAVAGSFSIGGAGLVRGWMRWEQFTPTTLPEGTIRSFNQLIEVDCQGGRGRLLALDLYPYNNLQGAPRHVDAQDPQWTYARPGTVLEQNIALMCSAAKSVVAAAVMQTEGAQPPHATTAGAMTTALAATR